MADAHSEIAFDTRLVSIGLDATTPDEVIRALGGRLLAQGYVDEDYIEAVIAREHEFATGLPTAIPVALPHTEARHCMKSSLAVGILRRPVEFQEMGNPGNTLSVRVVFLLALADPKDQVAWLQRFMRGLRDGGLIERLSAAASEPEVVDLVGRMLKLSPANAGAGHRAGGPGDRAGNGRDSAAHTAKEEPI